MIIFLWIALNITPFFLSKSLFTNLPFIGMILANVFTSYLILFSINLLMSIIIFIFILNFFIKILYWNSIYSYYILKNFTITQSELSEFFDIPSTSFFHPKAEKDKMKGQMIHYFDENYLNCISSCDNIVVEINRNS